MIYPDLHLIYTVNVESKGKNIEVTVDLDRPIPRNSSEKWASTLNSSGSLFGKPWIMDGQSGIFRNSPTPLMTTQPNYLHTGNYHDGKIAGRHGQTDRKRLQPDCGRRHHQRTLCQRNRKFTSRPDDPYNKVTIESLSGDLQLFDGRMNHNNGWFVLRSNIKPGVTKGAVKWIITPNVVADWMYQPVIQTSQIGYHPTQDKEAVIEMDIRDNRKETAQIIRIDADGEKVVKNVTPANWGKFLRYNYLKVNFTDVKEPGLYKIKYNTSVSPIFRIDNDVYARGVWQPVLEYFLPVQMCHMRVNEKYRVWHDCCHGRCPDGTGTIISTATTRRGPVKFKPGEVVPGVNIGGWHDAGDFDLRIESPSRRIPISWHWPTKLSVRIST